MPANESLPARAAWIETCRGAPNDPRRFGNAAEQSLPARAAWIETRFQLATSLRCLSLPARAAWIETYQKHHRTMIEKRRCPRGQRGLKPTAPAPGDTSSGSLPARAAWIETRSG